MAAYSDLIARHFESIMDALPDGVFISDARGIALHVNRMYELLTGLTKQQIEGKKVRSLVEDGLVDCILNPEIVRTRKATTRVQRLKNGKRLVLTGLPVFDQRGELCLVITFVRDVTLLGQIQDQVSAQSTLIEQMNDQLAYVARSEDASLAPVYESAAMAEVVNLLKRFAETDATVLLLGETGSGKDVFARYTHAQSARRNKLLLKIDCGGISESLLESELFGYMPGAFTGASAKGKAGYFEIANESTVFLDEVGELPLSMQTRLLRVLQDGEIVRVGASNARKVNVRIIAATNRNLLESVENGTFRRDLFYRLNVATVHIPPLRERQDDIRPLAEYFLQIYTNKYHKKMAFMQVTLDLMTAYNWPGNVRELQNCIHSLVISKNGPLLTPHDLPEYMSGKREEHEPYAAAFDEEQGSLREIVAKMERDFLLNAIRRYGSVQKVADRFGVNRSTIFRKLQVSRSHKD